MNADEQLYQILGVPLIAHTERVHILSTTYETMPQEQVPDKQKRLQNGSRLRYRECYFKGS